MSNVFIFHGGYGHPNENWFPWLKQELEKRGYQVFVPHFPTPENQSLESWREVFQPYEKFLDADSILIGHSIGAGFALRLLEKYRAQKTIIVAGFVEVFPENAQFNTASFVGHPFDWETIRKNCPEFFIFHADNDPYIPLVRAENMARHLHANLNVVPGAGHFNEKAGYVKFEKLLELF